MNTAMLSNHTSHSRRAIAPAVPALFCAALFLFAATVPANEVAFDRSGAVQISGEIGSAIVAADMNRDGRADLITGTEAGQVVVRYQSTVEPFTYPTSLAMPGKTPGEVTAMAVGDLNRDGLPDIVTTTQSGGSLGWYRNLTTTPTPAFDARSFVDGGFEGPRAVAIGDIDQDGFPDLIASDFLAGTVMWYRSSGSQTPIPDFGSVGIANDPSSPTGLALGDFDGDGTLDVVSSFLNSDRIAVYRNIGGSGFNFAATIVTQDPDGSDAGEGPVDGARAVAAGDVNGDGWDDIVAAGWFNDSVVLYLNNRTRTLSFEERILSIDPDGQAGSGEGFIESPSALKLVDLDQDGDLDIVTISEVLGDVYWFDNDGSLSSESTIHIIRLGQPGCRSLDAGDFDRDGDSDLCGAFSTARLFTAVENASIHRKASISHELPVTSFAPGVRNVRLADIDRDGDLDVLAAQESGKAFVWYENNLARGGGWSSIFIPSSNTRKLTVTPGDFDRDGDIDLITLSVGTPMQLLHVYINQNNGQDWSEFSLGFLDRSPQLITAWDVDRDGLLDFVAPPPSGSNSTVGWWQNFGTPRSRGGISPVSFSSQAVPSAISTPMPFCIPGDFTNNGQTDLLAVDVTNMDLYIYRNVATSSFQDLVLNYVPGTNTLTGAIASADRERDGDLDFFFGVNEGFGIASGSSNGGSWSSGILSNPINPAGCTWLETGDADLDGDADTFAAAAAPSPLMWVERTGEGPAFQINRAIGSSPDKPTTLALGDIDGDGDLDLVAGFGDAGFISWFENDNGQFGLETGDTAPAGIEQGLEDDMLALDIDHNGRPGDGALEIATVTINFDDGVRSPLSDAEITSLVSGVSLYRDTGDGIFDPDDDVIVGQQFPAKPDRGLLTVHAFEGRGGTPEALIAQSPGTGRFFVTVTLTADAASQTPNAFRIGVVQVVCENASYDIAALQMPGGEGSSSVMEARGTPEVSFRLATSTINENISFAQIPVDLDIASGSTVTVNYAVIAGGTATTPQDFILAAGTLSFVPPIRTQNISVAITDNTTFEPSETVIIELSNPVNASLGAITQNTLTILDNDPVPTVSFEFPTLTFNEDGGTGTPRVLASNASSLAMSVDIGITGGLATEGEDYSISPFTVSFAPGATAGSYNFNLLDDNIDEFVENANLTLLNASNCVIDPVLRNQTILINDDEATPTIQFDLAAQDVSESSSKTGVGISLSGPSANTVTVEIFTADGTAESGDDYEGFKTTVIFDPLVTFASFPFSILEDKVIEGTESFTIDLSDPSNADLGSPASHLVNITDNDGAATVQFAFATSELNEGNGDPAQIQVTVTPTINLEIMVDFAVTGGTATNDDHTLAAGTLTIPALFTGGTIPVPITEDLLDELDETVEITLSNPVNATLGSPSVHTLQILDDDGAPLVSFAPTLNQASEDSGTAHVEVVLDAPSGLVVTVDVQVSGGSATDPDDYALPLGVATFQPGETSFLFPITLNDDAVFEFNEFIQFALANPDNAALGSQSTSFLDILENEGFPVAIFTQSASTVIEDVGSTQLEVQLSPAASFDILLFFEPVGGTAVDPDDFTFETPDLNIPALTTTGNFQVNIVDDLLIEGPETADIQVFLGGGKLGDQVTLGDPPDIHTLTIADNEGLPEVNFVVTDSFWFENQGTAFIDVQLSAAFPQDVTVDIVASGGSATETADYTIDTPTITFTDGITVVSVQVSIIDDTEEELDETFELALTNPVNAVVGAQATHLGTIFGNDEPLSVAFSEASSSVFESDGDFSTIFVVLNQFPKGTVTVDYTVTGGSASNGTDYTLADGTVSFVKGSQFEVIPFTLIEDSLLEGEETFSVSLSNPIGAELGVPAKHTVIIVDSEPSPPLTPDIYTSTEPPVVNQFTQILGDDWGDFMGGLAQATAMGDFNDDGYDDVAIGSYGADRAGSTINVGELNIVFGGQHLSAVPTLDLNSDGAPIQGVLRLIGENVLDEFGFSVASGDVNGDRIDDLIVGAWRKTFQGDTFGGKGYVFYGRRDLPKNGIMDITLPGNEPDVVILPRSAKGFLGLGLEAGDLNGDGYADVVISAPLSDLNLANPDTGNVFIIWGGDSVPSVINLAQPAVFDGEFFTYTQAIGQEARGTLGYSVAIGDFDVDGVADLALGAPGTVTRFVGGGSDASDERGLTITIHGQVFVLAGESFLRTLQSINIYQQQQPSVTERGNFTTIWNYINDAPQFTNMQLGNVMAPTGSLSLLGKDLAVSMWGNDPGAPAGQVAMIAPNSFCCGGIFSIANLGLDSGIFQGLFAITPDNAEPLLWGDSLAAGSIDGNGDDDLWVGISDTDVSGNVNAGLGRVLRVDELFFGSSGNATFDSLNAYALGRGLSNAESFARSAAADADVNGDGFGDMLFGVPNFDNLSIPDLPPGQPDPRNNDAGAGFVLWGRPTAFDPVPTGRDRIIIPFGQPIFAKLGPEVRAWVDFPGFISGDRGKFTSIDIFYIRGEDPVSPDKELIPIPGVWIAAGFAIGSNGCDFILRYGDKEVADLNIDETTLGVFFDNGHGNWLPLPSTPDPGNNTVRTTVHIEGLKLGLMGLERTTGFSGLMVE